MNDRVFLDTNILVYARDISERDKNEISRRIIGELWEKGTGCISTQVCNEFYVTVTSKLSNPLTAEEAWLDIEDFGSWSPIPLTMSCLEIARDVQKQYKISWWDSLIIAAAVQGGCGKIYSEDLNSGQSYLGLEVVNPFCS
jgi:predicted nucleic acid-binding protein